MSDIAIIVDVWKYRVDVPELTGNDLCLPIINFLDSGIVDIAVLSSYDCNRELFSKKAWFKERPIQLSIDDLKKNITSKQQTHDLLLNYENSKIRQLSMRTISELKKIVRPDDTIYMLGGAFEICLKYRDLGYVNVKKSFPNNRVLTNINCVKTNEWKNPDMSNHVDWIKNCDNIYEYKPF